MHHFHHHGFHDYGMGSWVAHTVARGLLYRVIDAVTRGMGVPMLVILAVAALGVVWMARRA